MRKSEIDFYFEKARQKKDKYKFVRFLNLKKLQKELNIIRIGTIKLYVNIIRLGRNEQNNKDKSLRIESQQKEKKIYQRKKMTK